MNSKTIKIIIIVTLSIIFILIIIGVISLLIDKDSDTKSNEFQGKITDANNNGKIDIQVPRQFDTFYDSKNNFFLTTNDAQLLNTKKRKFTGIIDITKFAYKENDILKANAVSALKNYYDLKRAFEEKIVCKCIKKLDYFENMFSIYNRRNTQLILYDDSKEEDIAYDSWRKETCYHGNNVVLRVVYSTLFDNKDKEIGMCNIIEFEFYDNHFYDVNN